MELTPVRVEFIVRAQEAIAQLQLVNAEMDKVAVKGKLAGTSMATMEKSSRLAGTALLGLGSVFGLVAYESIKSAMDLQTSQTRLQVAVKNSGVSFAAAKPVIDKHAEAMTKLGFTTQDTYEALGTMVTATRSPQMSLNALGAAADLARYKHISLAQASTLVSRAALGQARGLADLGLAINKTIPKGASFAQIMALIETRTHGAANAFAQTSQGQLLVLQARFKALTEDLGTQLLPAFNKIVAWIDGPGLNALKKLSKWFSDNKPIVVAFTTALAVIWAAPKIDAMLAAMKALVLGWQGVAAAAGEAAAAEGAAGAEGGAASVAKMGPLTSLIRSPITAMAAIAAGVGYEFYKAGTDKGPPQKPVIGGKAGGAATAQYQKELAAYNANQPKQNMFAYEYQNTENSAAATGSPNLAGYGPAPLVSSATKTKKPSVAQLKKQKAGGTPVTTHTSVMLDSKVIAKATATHATHGSTLTAGKTK